jgi:hypothetical protein
MWRFVLGLLETVMRRGALAMAKHWRPIASHVTAAALGACMVVWMQSPGARTESVPSLPEIRPSAPTNVLLDSSAPIVDTTCAVVPQSFAPAEKGSGGAPTQKASAEENTSTNAFTAEDFRGGMTGRLYGPPSWLAVDVAERRPAIEVGEKRVRLQGADPRSGQLRQYIYEVPQQPFFLEASLSASILKPKADPRLRAGLSAGYKDIGVGVSAAPGHSLKETLSLRIFARYRLNL